MKNKIKDEKYKEEVLQMRKFYPLIYIFLILIILILGLYFVGKFDMIFTNKFIPYEETKTIVQEDVPFSKGTTNTGINLQIYSVPNDSLIAKGKEIYMSTCSPCHGETGNGDGAAAAALNPKPRNFHTKDSWTNGRKFSDIFKTLEEGINNTGMSSYESLPITDIFEVIHYIRSLEKDFPKITNDEINQLDNTYHLSQGGTTPNTIPIETAMQKIIDENSVKIESLLNIIRAEKQNKSEEGAILFNKVSKNKFRSLYFLLNAKPGITSCESFIKEIYYTIPENGFKNKILIVNKDKQQILYDYLMKLLKNTN